MLRPARVRLILLVAAIAAGAGAAAYFFWPRVPPGPEAVNDEAPDPRLTFDTPFRNVKPDVRYVGDKACAPCHKDIDHSYHQHAMGRSAHVMPTSDKVVRYEAVNRPEFTSFGNIDYKIDIAGDKVIHTETIKGPDGKPAISTSVEALLSIGSGNRGRSYLCSRDGSLWQSEISWFSEKQIWDASPGFGPGRHGQRAILPKCLFCHVNTFEAVPDTVNRFAEPFLGQQAHIGCERCHGPGSLHVAERAASDLPKGTIDTSIVNPKHLEPDLREDVCRQCHFQGSKRVLRRGRGEFDYRPGLPFESFVAVFTKHPDITDYHKSVGQVEQTAVSKCATASNGKFGCISCHDPHVQPAAATKDAYYRDRCNKCHADKGCSAPVAVRKEKNDSCIECHMSKAASANVVHTSVTDHRVLRVPQPSKTAKGTLSPGALPVATMPGQRTRGPSQAEQDRDLGIALVEAIPEFPKNANVSAEAVRLLKAATAKFPTDVEAWESLAVAHSANSQWSDMLKAAERAVEIAPRREQALAKAAEAAMRLHQVADAVRYARTAVEVNPGSAENRLLLVLALMTNSKFGEAEKEARALLTLCPNSVMGRVNLAVALHRQGKATAAREELERAVAVNPKGASILRNYFEQKIQ